ncbi:ribose-phosphate diphosphokinase [Halanaeroarchaeum sulfurireducens]|uniref:Ribose-phosphate pyrophosphokinase n=1 Tax=Halanaeroarchaeum sulfurireducens TaxID=1604004 RepID=A0A0F7P693_9EURY|nr:ribose-phosphate diphosphokinase [Halanaeroarchaeum sulfurireducens]AKH96656.1 ribose-phosphate pyrophosphokinase [Halanaeroarchaeum sulfurireducens]ALG81058.1 ribose-phosphate pyrophosphokinase [Halanaeroarchaeum sulfurireducens]
MIVSTRDSQTVAAAIAEETGDTLAETDYEQFPDGELLVEVPPIEGRAVVVGSTVSSEAHLELLLLQDAVREAGATAVVTVIPYMGYARQDEAFTEGQPVSARAVAQAISTGTDRVVAVNLHEAAVADFFDVPVDHVDAAGVLADPLPADLDSPVFLSPDEGAIGLAETVRDANGTGAVDYFEKERDYDSGAVTVTPSEIEVADRDVVVVDDIVATGSTMSEAIAILQDRDPNRVFVATVHPLFVGNARSKLANAGVAAVFGTDTIERAVSATSVAPVVAATL